MDTNLPQTIAIDGPVAAGKTTVGKLVAQKLRYLCVDTGFFYRAVTYLTLKKGLDVKDNEASGEIAKNADIEIKSDNSKTLIFSDGENITPYLRTPEVDKTVSYPSANPVVRSALTPRMRKVARENKVIMIGRDIGTVVLPHADLKIWLDADTKTRAKRRTEELKSKGLKPDFHTVLEDMLKRDKIDGGRDVAPMQIPVDAVIIDTSDLTIPQVVKKVSDLITSCKEKN